jgi:site-specific recombinase XerD
LTLLEAIPIYVERKRANGHLYVIHERRLIYFSRHVGDVPLEQISVRQVLTFLDSPKISPMAWKKKHEFLRGFFDFWLARGTIKVSPMPPKRNATARTSVPYIYTQAEIQTLLRSAQNYQRGGRCISSLTISTFLIFLYGTGCLPSEAIRLSLRDVDLKKGMIFIRDRRLDQLREFPMGPDLKSVLSKYLIVRRRVASSNDHFFLNKWGKALGKPTINKTFQRIRLSSGIVRRDDAFYQPRMQDLRHTFAVHRITSWIKHGADLKRMLPALAAYMGQYGLGSTERYLSLTAERFRPQLSQLSPSRGRKRWRDDAELMKFLEEL